jgi:hypothetical protein
MKLKYLLIFFGVVFLMTNTVSGQKSRITIISEIRRDSIVNLLKKFGLSADLYYDQFVTQRSGIDILSNEEGTKMFESLFSNMNDTCIFNYLDTARFAGIPYHRGKLKATDSVPDSKLRFLSYLSPGEYIKLHGMLYSSGDGSSSDLDTNSIRVINESERKYFGKKYKIDVLAGFSFSGENDSLSERYIYDNQRIWLSIAYEKYTIKDEVILKNFHITKIRQRPGGTGRDTIPPIEPVIQFSVEPYLQAGLTGAKHTYHEAYEDYLSGKAGKSIDLGVNFSYPFKLSEDNKYLDLGLGIGYSMLTLPLSLNNYDTVYNNLTPPFQTSAYFTKYYYFMTTSQVKENQILGFVNIPVFARLRIPVKKNMEAFFKLGFHTTVPIHTGYRTDGKINYSGEFHYVVNNKETVISTNDNDANLESSIPNFNTLYGQKKSLSSEKLSKSFGVSSKFETGFSFKASDKIKYFVGAYVSYRISGLTYGNDSELIGQEGRINSFLTKTDKINPLGFGLTLSVSFDVLKDSFKKNK